MSGDLSKLGPANDLPLIPVKITASGIVFEGPCVFKGFVIMTDETNNLKAEFYDDTVADVNLRGALNIVGSDLSGGKFPPGIVRIKTLLRVVITTAGGGYVLAYYNDYKAA